MASSTRESRGVTLVCHPDTPCVAVRAVTARVGRSAGGTLTAHYMLEGDVARLCLPASRPPYVGDRLWQHTCCEIFISRGAAGYHEFNFSPSGAWAAYAFESYRDGAPLPGEVLSPPPVSELAVRSAPDKIELDASIRLDLLSPRIATAKLLLAVSAVIEDGDGRLSYWALRHPPGKPDFHHRDGFALELDEVRN